MQVHRLMSPHPVTIRPDASLEAALGLMHRYEIHELPVLDRDRLVGIITERDLRTVLGQAVADMDEDRMDAELLAAPVERFMTGHVEGIHTQASIAEAARKLAWLRIGALPVVDGDGDLRGILSVTDLLLELAHRLERDGE